MDDDERRAAPRLAGVDATRGVALLGMMAVHVMPDSARGPVAADLASGRSAATFAVLAGVGLALATRRTPWGRSAAATFVRALLIGLLGLAVGIPDSGVAVILVYYAVFFVLAIPLLRLPVAALAVVSLVVAVGAPVLGHELRPRLAEKRFDNPTYGDLGDPGRLLQELTITGYYPALSWLAYLAAGLAVGRLALGRPRVQITLVGVGTALALGAKAASQLLLGPGGGRDAIAATLSPLSSAGEVDELIEAHRFGTTPTDTYWWLATSAPHSGTPPDLLHTIGVALAVLGAFLLLAGRARRLLVPLAAAGSMTLTLYSGHVLALASDRLPQDDETSYAIQLVVALVVATLWRWRLRRGPLEAVIALVVRVATGGGRRRVPASAESV